MPDFIHLYEPGVPMLVMLHGTGGDEQDMMAFGQELRQPGMGVLAPRGKSLFCGFRHSAFTAVAVTSTASTVPIFNIPGPPP